MAKVGNHGIIIPRNRQLLRQLYWQKNLTTPEIGALFGVGHKSVINVMREVGVPTRSKGKKPIRGCIICGDPPQRILHRKNGAVYGRRCVQHQREHKAQLARKASNHPEVRKRKKFLHDRWYYFGPLKPEGELSWLSKGRSLLRSAKRQLAAKDNRALLQSLNVVLRRGQTLPI